MKSPRSLINEPTKNELKLDNIVTAKVDDKLVTQMLKEGNFMPTQKNKELVKSLIEDPAI